MTHNDNGAPVESREHASPELLGKALYALTLIFACALMPIGALLTFFSGDWR